MTSCLLTATKGSTIPEQRSGGFLLQKLMPKIERLVLEEAEKNPVALSVGNVRLDSDAAYQRTISGLLDIGGTLSHKLGGCYIFRIVDDRNLTIDRAERTFLDEQNRELEMPLLTYYESSFRKSGSIKIRGLLGEEDKRIVRPENAAVEYYALSRHLSDVPLAQIKPEYLEKVDEEGFSPAPKDYLLPFYPIIAAEYFDEMTRAGKNKTLINFFHAGRFPCPDNGAKIHMELYGRELRIINFYVEESAGEMVVVSAWDSETYKVANG